MKDNRAISFVIVTLVYLIATAVGVVSYVYLPFAPWLSLLLADIIATAVTFIFSLIFSNASVYDPYWSVQPIVIVLAFLLTAKFSVAGLVMAIVVCAWGVRLTANWAYTFKSLRHQDWRYTMLKEKTKNAYPLVNFLGIHLFPTLVVYLCVMPAVQVITTPVTLNIGYFIFLAVSLLAVVLQTVSDIQMQAFRKNRTTPFIRVGLWKHSRHPNYLGEILMWWGVALSAVCVLKIWYLITGAVVNTVMFLVVSIPMADKRQSRKDGYDEYKRQTRILLPIKKFTKK